MDGEGDGQLSSMSGGKSDGEGDGQSLSMSGGRSDLEGDGQSSCVLGGLSGYSSGEQGGEGHAEVALCCKLIDGCSSNGGPCEGV